MDQKYALYVFKSTISIVALIFSIIIVNALIFSKYTRFATDVHPGFAFIAFWFCLFWLSIVEGGQASLVGLPPIDRSLYEKSHPITFSICSLAHRGDNLNRYLLGRQFMVLVLVFMINNCGSPLEGAKVFDLPDVIVDIFLGSGLAMILITCMIGQLNSQVNASLCMIDYINTRVMTFTLYVCLAIEFSGLLHSSYLIQIIVTKLAGKKVDSFEPPRTPLQNFFFWGRIIYSTGLLIMALVFTFDAIVTYKTTMWAGIPNWISILFFLGLMSVVGMLEGMQIAFFAYAKLSEAERGSTYWSKKISELLFRGEGHNLPGFMVGRQLMVVATFFIIARCTTMVIPEGEENVLGVGDNVQGFFGTGLLGALITTIIASIAWQLVAGQFPQAFFNSSISYVLLVICLGFQASGICNGAWVIASVHKKIAGFKIDEAYVGTAEERQKAKSRTHVVDVAL
eukprot:c8087_g2_i1.p1 GENE.c8087_g2_i1~~c8087_g2_i1.p1  ORF type:complete len:454 (-),score=88.71 c8087_g2_i1:78-1439(-)